VTLSLRYAAGSDVGLVRAGNEDSGYAGPRLLVIADGMGGHAAGEVASSLVVASLASLDDDDLGGDLLDALSAAVASADRTLRRTIDADDALEGMGTTLTALLWSGTRVGLAHVGDSRGYLMRGGDLLRLTHDHTYVQSLVDSGQISAEEAEHHPRRSLLMRAMDGRNPAQPDLSVREVRAGDRFLLCSDGLSGVVSEETIAEELREGDPADIVQKLIALALRSGAPDNVTVVIAEAVDHDDRPSTSAQVVGAAAEPRLAERAAEAIDESPAVKARRALNGDADADADRRTTERISENERQDRSERRSRWLRRTAVIAVVAALIIAGLSAAFAWINTQYYVGIQDARVAVFRGVDQQIGAVQLSKAVEVTDLDPESLPETDRDLVVAGVAASDLAAAQAVVERLRASAAECALADPPDGCPPAPIGIDDPVTPTPAVDPVPTAVPFPAATAPSGSGR
jgi:protein phosphatase